MSHESPAVNIEVTAWKLEKFETDPTTGERTLIETIVGGDGLPTETIHQKDNQ